MSAVQIIFTVVIAIFSMIVIVSFFRQGAGKGSVLYKFYLFGLVGVLLIGMPLANDVILLRHVGIGVGSGVLFLFVNLMIYGHSEVNGQRVWPHDALFLMVNKRRRQAVKLAKDGQWQQARDIFEELLNALPARPSHRRMVCIHDITTCAATLGDVAAIESFITVAREKYSKNPAFILQLYNNLFTALKKEGQDPCPCPAIAELEQFINDNVKRLSKFRFIPEEGTILKGTAAANALLAWVKDCEE